MTYFAHVGIELWKNPETLDCAEPGRESVSEPASLACLIRYPEPFFRSGTDVGSGEIVSRCSSWWSLSSISGGDAGEKSGMGNAEYSVCASDETLSDDDCALPTVCPLRRG